LSPEEIAAELTFNEPTLKWRKSKSLWTTSFTSIRKLLRVAEIQLNVSIFLSFPEIVQLVAKAVVDQDVVSNELEFCGFPLSVDESHPKIGGVGVGHAHYVYWKVGRNKDVQPSKKGPFKKKKNHLAEAFFPNAPAPGRPLNNQQQQFFQQDGSPDQAMS